MLWRKPRVLDLCSGLGGATEALVQAECEVVRIENNPLLAYVPHTHTLDVTEWADWLPDLGPFDIVWASPPCLGYSDGYNAPKIVARREGREYVPDPSVALACREIIDYLKPRWYIIENVKGAIPYFEGYGWGRHQQSIGPFYLWGQFPQLDVSKQRMMHKKKTDNTGSQARALVPFEISFALLEAIRSQRTLEDFT